MTLKLPELPYAYDALAPYMSAEIYFDTRYDRFNRYRLIAGVSLPIAGPFTLEPYYAYQVDVYPSDKFVNAFGLVLIASF